MLQAIVYCWKCDFSATNPITNILFVFNKGVNLITKSLKYFFHEDTKSFPWDPYIHKYVYTQSLQSLVLTI